MSIQSGSRASMWANMHNCITLKVGVTRSLKVDLCASGAGAYAPYAPPLPTGLNYSTFNVSIIMYRNTGKNRYSLVLQEVKGLTKKLHIPNV